MNIFAYTSSVKAALGLRKGLILLGCCAAGLAACGPDETISGFVEPDAVYHLITLDGAPFAATATLRFPDTGQVNGRGPCNSFATSQTEFYPWFKIGPIRATRRACPALSEEARYFEALGAMAFAEVSGNVLLLTGEGGREMTFEAQ